MHVWWDLLGQFCLIHSFIYFTNKIQTYYKRCIILTQKTNLLKKTKNLLHYTCDKAGDSVLN